jgi:outer membrane lipopolysaccharide assembly protein LptE/RlpB
VSPVLGVMMKKLKLIYWLLLLAILAGCSYQFSGSMKCKGDCELIIERSGETAGDT